MEKLVGFARVSDIELETPKNVLDVKKLTHERMARSMAEKLVEEGFERMVMERKNNIGNFPHLEPGVTEFKMEAYVLSEEEWNEYQYLKRFQGHMHDFVNSGGNF